MQLYKIKKLTLRVNLVLAASCYSLLAETAPLDISQQPLAGVVLQYAPNLVLALSVEFPTAGPAYTTIGKDQGREIKHNEHLKMLYRGYFDPEKCYSYNGKHFEPAAMSQTIAGRVGMCPGTGHFSGSFMNFMTASALDVFRQTLTGGNRAYGTGVDHLAYAAGDRTEETYVRRSQPGSSYSGNNFVRQHSTMKGRRIDLQGATQAQIDQLLPGHYARNALKDIVDGITSERSAGLAYQRGYRKLSKNYEFPRKHSSSFNGLPLAGEFPGNYPSNFSALAEVDKKDRFADHYLYFTNTKFGAYAYRRMITADGKNQYFAIAPNMQYENIVVRVCKSGFLEENCVKYDNGNYKPEGLLQKYSRTGMRVAAFGYLNVGEFTNSPVLRSRMKHLDRTETVASITYGQEWNHSTGQFVLNPDTTDANASGVQNSGVINYLNKFGDVSGYKQYDIGAELYYAALRYLRGGANGKFGSLDLSTSRAHYVRSAVDEKMKDGFPAIYNWDDPILRGLGKTAAEAAQSPQAQCRTSSIIYIGDTNTWEDRGLPNFDSTGFTSGDFDDIQTKTYLQALLTEQKLGANTWNSNRGARNSPPGMAGLAYWARVNDIRSDIPGVQSGNNFILDVVENGTPKGFGNTYWLAAKYGGFDLKKASDFAYGGASYKMPVARDAWTDDAPNTSSIPGFFGGSNDIRQGIPRNFGVANNPDSMKKSLEKAFAAAGTFDKPSQSSIGLTVPAGEKMDLTTGALIINNTFDAANLTGDLILSRIRFNAGSLQFEEQWKSSTKLNNAYHNTGNAWMSRSVFTKDGSMIKSLQNVTLPGSHAVALRRFVLGSKQDEGTLWRKRKSLMGTTVYGAPVSILKPSKIKPDGDKCSFGPSAMGREVHYAVAANDGMFHIFDSDGDEKIAYIPSTVLPKLEANALPDAAHAFLNDGSAVYADVCFESEAKSVVLANTGRGGAAVYALDVTDLGAASANNVLWEFSSVDDADLGLTVGKVSVSKNGAGKPIAVFSSGFNNASEKGYVFVLDITNRGTWVQNVNYWKIALGSNTVQGVGEPFVFDKNMDGTADHIYVGDYNGRLWRVDHDADNDLWVVANSGVAMFTPAAADAAPITGSPFVQNVRGKTYVTFGTGQYLNDDGVEESVQNYAYGLIDESNTIALGTILEQEIVKVATSFAPVKGENTRELWEISGNTFDDATHKGWRLRLQKGQTIVARPTIRGGEVAEYVAISRGSNATDICAIAGSTSIISLSLRSGGNYPAPLFDTTGDGIVDSSDVLGGMVTIKGQISPYAVGFEAIVGGKTTYIHAGVSDTGSFAQAGRVFNIGSVMLRINHREVPL